MIRLDFREPSHTLDEMIPLYERFKADDPETFERWKLRVKSGLRDEAEDWQVLLNIKEFVKPFVEWKTQPDLSLAVSDFQKLMRREIQSERHARS